MKVSDFKKRVFCLLLSLSFLVQSCNVYKRNPIAIEEAVEAKEKVRIIKNDNKKIFLKRIEKTDGVYYGVANYKGHFVKIPLDETNIQKIQIRDKTASTIVTIATIVTGTGLLAGIVALIVFASEWDDDWGSSSTTTY